MLYTAYQEKKEILLEIKTIIIDEIEKPEDDALVKILTTLADCDDLDLGKIFNGKEEESENVSEVSLATEAVIETNAHGNIEISYRENEDDPQITSLSKIIFSPKEPKLVLMEKQGAISSLLSFEESKTHICEYETPFMPFKIYVSTEKVENSLLQDGKLKLEYVLNINDTPPQRFLIRVAIKDAPADELKALFS